MLEHKGVQIRWYGHDTFTLTKNITICIDPYKIKKPISADLLLISHNHFDHLSEEDLKKISNNDTIIVAANECLAQLSKIPAKEKISILPNEEKTILNVKIRAVPAYNIDKINPDTNKPFHPKEDKKVGFVITLNDVSFYHTGDSDFIPEMENVSPDVMFVPVSGTYVMTPKEAINAVQKIKPKLAIPMHYGTIVGSNDDALEFKNGITVCDVQIPTKE